MQAIHTRQSTTPIQQFNTRLTQIENRVCSLEQGVSKPNETLVTEAFDELRFLMNEREQSHLRNDLEIVGLDEADNEDPIKVLSSLGEDVGVVLDERDIVSIERVGPRRSHTNKQHPRRPRPLVVRLARRAVRDNFLRAARKRSSTNMSDIGRSDIVPRRVYVNERLTRMNYELFCKVREICRHKKWRYIWIKNGKVFVRRDSESVVHCIRQEIDIPKVFENI